MSRLPKVSVCVPSYNHAQFLSATLDGILAQTYTDFEVVIVDDGSSDGSLGIAQDYAARHPELIRVLTHPHHENRGIAATVNLAFENTTGEYWMGLPSDDIMYPDKLERQVEFLDNHPEVGWVYGYANYVDATDQPLPGGLFGENINHAADPLESLIERNVIPGMTVLMRRETSQKVGLHEPAILYSDWEYWVRMLVQSKVGFIDRPVIKYRIHSYNVSVGVDFKTNTQRSVEVLQSLKRKSDSIGGDLQRPRTQALLELQLTYNLFCLGETRQAEQALASAFEADPVLQKDARFFSEWLKRRMREVAFVSPRHSHPRTFALWVLTQLPSAVGRRMRHQIAAVGFGIAALDNYQVERRQTRRLALSCVANDARWLGDKRLRSVLLESLMGSRITRGLRSLQVSLRKGPVSRPK